MKRPIPPKFYADGAPSPSRMELRAIGVVHSPHRERHGTPRQAVLPADPGLRPDEHVRIELFSSVFSRDALEGLSGFDYIWVLSWLHLNRGWNNRVQAPGETKKTGLLATRAPHRPNPLGLSAARLLAVDGFVLTLERCDLLNGTPVLDIKPYIPYADAFPDARAGWVDERGGTPVEPSAEGDRWTPDLGGDTP